MNDIPCLCDGRTDIVCTEDHCDIAGPGEPGNANSCRVCWHRLGKPVPKGPSFLQKAVNFAGAAAKHVMCGSRSVPDEVAEQRLAICKECEFFSAEDVTCRHKKCGCKMVIKATWADQKCPLDPPKWGPYVEKPNP